MTDDLVKRAREALAGVTKKPWRIGPDEEGEPAQCITADGFDIATCWGGYNAAEADARFIVAARDLVPQLADRIADLERQLAAAVAAVSDAGRRRGEAEARLDRAVEALRPFVAYVHDEQRKGNGAYRLMPCDPHEGGWIGAEDLRRAYTIFTAYQRSGQ